MAWTQEQLDALDLAIAGSTLTVKMGEKTLTYRSMDELLKARAAIVAGLAGTSGRMPRFQVASFED